MEKGAMRRQILLRVSELLAEKGLIDSLEENAMKRIIGGQEMQGGRRLWKGEEIGTSGNL